MTQTVVAFGHIDVYFSVTDAAAKRLFIHINVHPVTINFHISMFGNEQR